MTIQFTAALVPLHASLLDGHLHGGYQALAFLVIAGLWLFLAGVGERRWQRDEDVAEASRARLAADPEHWE